MTTAMHTSAPKVLRVQLTPLAQWALGRCGATIHSEAVCMRAPDHEGDCDRRIAPRTYRRLIGKA
jgi:hypothetical protein